MTSTTDEITNLRAALAAIASKCKTADRAHAATAIGHIATMAQDGLRTQRASKIVEQDTLRLNWLLEHCDIAYRIPRATTSERQLYANVRHRSGLDTLREYPGTSSEVRTSGGSCETDANLR